MNERYKLNAQLAQMLKGGVIMDVTTLEQARIALLWHWKRFLPISVQQAA